VLQEGFFHQLDEESVMVYFVKCFTQVYCTQIGCVPSFSETFNDITDSVYSMNTTYPFLKPNWLLLVWRNSVNFSVKQYSNNF